MGEVRIELNEENSNKEETGGNDLDMEGKDFKSRDWGGQAGLLEFI